MSNYANYCNEEKAAGRKPLSMKEWAQARTDPQPSPNDVENDPMDTVDLFEEQNQSDAEVIETIAEELTPETLVFWHASRYHVEIMQAGQKVSINNSIVTIPHRQIEFTENHWTADMLDPQDREKAEWLMQCKEYRAGNILRVDEIIHQPRVEVRTGPRTTGHNQKQTNPRPAGELSAPLH